jgi:hypothetical protein
MFCPLPSITYLSAVYLTCLIKGKDCVVCKDDSTGKMEKRLVSSSNHC